MEPPKLSVIMGIYRSPDKDVVRLAFQSIVEQTFEDWEFVICDDGSPDDTWKFLNQEYGGILDLFSFETNATGASRCPKRLFKGGESRLCRKTRRRRFFSKGQVADPIRLCSSASFSRCGRDCYGFF